VGDAKLSFGVNGAFAFRNRETMLAQLRREGVSERVVEAIARVPREAFLPPEQRHLAYTDSAVPIGCGQTLPQPLIAGIMTSLLKPAPTDRVLEIGAGNGYQAAVLAELTREVVTTERVPELARRARETLGALGYGNRVRVEETSSELGYPPAAPYDAIVVTAASPKIPGVLLRQLAAGGRMVIPVGRRDGQELVLVVNTLDGPRLSVHGACRFVPLLGPDGWQGRESAA
jgi:protein-L-isoaspartate(D-aspartate) O-methyltransferase